MEDVIQQADDTFRLFDDKGVLKPFDEIEKIIATASSPMEDIRADIFTTGHYTREIYMAKGVLVTSRVHKTDHTYTVSMGQALVFYEGGGCDVVTAPHTGITKPGCRRLLYIMEGCIWTTHHPIPRVKASWNDLPHAEKQKKVTEIIEEITYRDVNPYLIKQ